MIEYLKTPMLDLAVSKLPNAGKFSVLTSHIKNYDTIIEISDREERFESAYNNFYKIDGYLEAMREMKKIGEQQYLKAFKENRKLLDITIRGKI